MRKMSNQTLHNGIVVLVAYLGFTPVMAHFLGQTRLTIFGSDPDLFLAVTFVPAMLVIYGFVAYTPVLIFFLISYLLKYRKDATKVQKKLTIILILSAVSYFTSMLLIIF